MLTLAQRFGARGLRVMGVAQSGEDEDERADVLRAAQEEKMSYPTMLDPTGTWWTAAEVGVIPTFIVVGKDGRVVHRYTGKLTEGSEGFTALAAAVERAIEG